MTNETTDWFPGDVKPVRIGVYQQRNPDGHLGYQRWDGKFWYSWESTIDLAARATLVVDGSFQCDPWRGLANKPKGGA